MSRITADVIDVMENEKTRVEILDINGADPEDVINKKLYHHIIRFSFTYNGNQMSLIINVYTNIKEQITDSNTISNVFTSLYNAGCMLLVDDKNIIFSTNALILGITPLTYYTRKAFIGETQCYLVRNQDLYKIHICPPDTIDLATGEINEKSFTAYDLTYVSDTVTEVIL